MPDLDRLAGAYITQRAYDKAEETYRHALVIRETLLGKDDADLIATVDGLAYACFGQKKYDQAKEAEDRANAIRAHFLASGLSGAATEQIEEGNKTAALALYHRALVVMDPPNPLYEELRSEIEEIVKNQEQPPKVTKKAPSPRKK